MIFNVLKISSLTFGFLSNLMYLMIFIINLNPEIKQSFSIRISFHYTLGIGVLSIILAILFAITLAYKNDISNKEKKNYRRIVFLLNLINSLFVGFMILMMLAFCFDNGRPWFG